MIELTALTINITRHALSPPPCMHATPHGQTDLHPAQVRSFIQVSKVRWMNVGIAQVKIIGRLSLVNHPGEVWTKETYSAGDPWR